MAYSLYSTDTELTKICVFTCKNPLWPFVNSHYVILIIALEEKKKNVTFLQGFVRGSLAPLAGSNLNINERKVVVREMWLRIERQKVYHHRTRSHLGRLKPHGYRGNSMHWELQISSPNPQWVLWRAGHIPTLEVRFLPSNGMSPGSISMTLAFWVPSPQMFPMMF